MQENGIGLIRSDLSNDLSGDETGIREVAESTRLHVAELLTVRDIEMVALCLIEAVHRRNASVIIVPDIEHADGIDCLVRDRVRLVTTAGERILARSGLGAKLAGVLDPS